MKMKSFFAVEKYLDKDTSSPAVRFNIKGNGQIYPRTGHEGPERE
jgi:hypothetical protein